MLNAAMVMKPDVVTVSPEATVCDAIDLLVEHEVSGLPVVNASGHIVGVLTEADLLRLLYENEAAGHTVSDYMTADAITVTEDESLTDVVDKILDRGIRRVPVVRDSEVVGVVARRDVIRYIRDTQRQVARRMSRSTTSPRPAPTA